MTQPNQSLDQLTSTRFFAALSVVLFHGGRNIGFLKSLPMLSSGLTAVSYFYVLSGLVLALVYYRPGEKFQYKNYLLARFSRIYPIYLLSFIITCIYYIELISKIKADKILANIFLYQAWFPEYSQTFNIAAWSLSVEVFFYLIFPLVPVFAKRLSGKAILWSALIFWLLSQLLHAALFSRYMPEMHEMLGYFPLFHLNAFLLGVAGGIWYLSPAVQKNINGWVNTVLLLTAFGAVMILLSLRDLTQLLPRSFSMDSGLLAPLFLIIILTLAVDKTILSKWLSHPWLVTLGYASYALYIFHIPVRWLIERTLDLLKMSIPFNTMYLIYLPSVILLSVWVYRYIERPARDWLRKYPQKLMLILIDVALIYLTIRLAFLLRLGDGISAFKLTQNFVLRVGLVIILLSLLGFGIYNTFTMRKLVYGILIGTFVLTGFMYFAFLRSWVEGFPRLVIILIAALTIGAIGLSRYILKSVFIEHAAANDRLNLDFLVQNSFTSTYCCKIKEQRTGTHHDEPP